MTPYVPTEQRMGYIPLHPPSKSYQTLVVDECDGALRRQTWVLYIGALSGGLSDPKRDENSVSVGKLRHTKVETVQHLATNRSINLYN